MRPRSIKIFLLDGDPAGIRDAQISMSTIHAIAFRKLQLSRVRDKYPDLSRAGIYLLLGFDELQPDRLVAYIGQAESVAVRLGIHAGKADRNFWTDTIALVSKDENLTGSHARYVEARLIADAGLNPRWTLQNTQKPSEDGKLPPAEREEMEEFIDQTKTLVGALSCDLFKVVTGTRGEASIPSVGEAPRSGTADEPLFHYKGRGFDAQMLITRGREFVLQKDSKCRLKTTNTVPEGVTSLRTALLEKDVLIEKNSALILTTDYIFRSVTAAAAMVVGASINGRTAWKLADGTTFADWESAQGGAAGAAG
jgi:hypothetical protein